MNTISWSSATTPVPMEINPRVVFERCSGVRERPRSGSMADRQEHPGFTDRRREGSGARAGCSRPRPPAASTEHVREVERRIQMSEKAGAKSLQEVDAPFGIPESFEEHARLMFELAALAYQADITRVAELHDGEGRQHDLAHEPRHLRAAPLHDAPPGTAGEHPEPGEDQHVSHEPLREFIERLSSTPDGDGSLLDHSLILFGSGMSEANTHSRLNIPTLLVGGRSVLQGQSSRQDRGGDAVCQLPADARQHLRVRARALRHAEHGRAVALNEAP